MLYFLSEYDILPGKSVVIVDIGGETGFIQKFVIDNGFKTKIISQTKREFRFLNGREIDQLLMEKLLLLFRKCIIDITEKSKILAEVERMKEALSFDETIK